MLQVGGLLAYGVGHINTAGVKSWQSIFLFLGCMTIALAPILMWVFPDHITTAKFLSDRERVIAIERLRDNNTGTTVTKWDWSQAREAVTDPKTWLWSFALLFAAIPSSGIGSFNTLITQGFGFE